MLPLSHHKMWQTVGQERAVELLSQALKKGVLSHAYLFAGPAHVGKMTLALDLARAVNCEASSPPCGVCRPCSRISGGMHSDVRVVGVETTEAEGERLKKEISIDQIRSIQHQVSLPPFEGIFRVFIIDGAEALSPEAANCLLKTLEEPVGNVIFILLATDEKLLPETVISRCQNLKLSRVPIGVIETYLKDRLSVPQDKASLLSRLSKGRIGWAINVSQDESILEKRSETIKEILGLIDADYETRFVFASKLAREFTRDSANVKEVLELMAEVWRDLLLVKVGIKDGILNINLESELAKLAKGISIGGMRDFVRNIRQSEQWLSQNANPRLVFDVLTVGMPEREGVGVSG